MWIHWFLIAASILIMGIETFLVPEPRMWIFIANILLIVVNYWQASKYP